MGAANYNRASGTLQSNIEDVALLLNHAESELMPITFVFQVVLKAMCKTWVLVSKYATGLLEVALHANITEIIRRWWEKKSWMCIHDVLPRRPTTLP